MTLEEVGHAVNQVRVVEQQLKHLGLHFAQTRTLGIRRITL
jgi:hypothetical protein